MIEHADYSCDLFISYADADRAWVEGYLLNALTQAGIRCHSEAAFTLGKPRLLEFERAVQGSRRTLLVLSPAYLADSFNQFTNLLAQTFGLETATWPVIPLILEPVKLPPRLAILTALDATDPAEWPEVIERLSAALQFPVPGPAPEPPCPYPGMAPFSEAESNWFFGRDAETWRLLEHLYRHPFVAVIGPSGSGKSSLVFAGLVPALRQSGLFGHGEWLIRTLRSGETPLASLNGVLPRERPTAQRLLLIVDQFEEVFTLARQDIIPFQQAVLRLISAPNCYVVLTVRADFYSDLMTTRLWGEAQAHRLEVTPLDEAGLRQAIVQPAEEVGVYVEAALVERLVADAAGEPGILPLVQETLVLLWERLERRFLPLSAYEALVLSSSAYEAMGGRNLTGLQVAIARHADTALANLTPSQQAIARRIFLRLVQFGEGRSDTRRQQPVSALRINGDEPGLFDSTLRELTRQRLLTLSGAKEDPDRQVDLAHEALINGWPKLEGWLAERREAEQTRRRLEAKAAEWVRLGQGSGGLLDEVELLEAKRWLESPDAADLGYGAAVPELAGASQEAIEAARRKREAARRRELEQARALADEQERRAEVERQRAEEQARSARRLGWLAIGLTVVLLLAAVAAGIARFQTVRSERLRLVSITQALAAQAPRQREQGKQDERGALLARQAYIFDRRGTGPALGQIDEALRAVLGAPYFSTVRHGHQGEIKAVAFSPDGHMLASVGVDGAVRLWDLSQPGTHPTTLSGHEGEVLSVAFSPDGHILASAGADGTLRLWDLRQPVITSSFLREREDVSVFSIAFNPNNGQMLATGSADGVVRVWDLNQPDLRSDHLRAREGDLDILAVAFSPDGQTLASGAGDGSLWLWDLRQPKPVPIALEGHEHGIRALAFSPDGGSLASGSIDKSVRVWDLSQPGARPTVLEGHDGEVWSLMFSPKDGHTLVSSSDDRTVRLWDLHQPNARATILRGHEYGVRAVAFRPDGLGLASGGLSGNLRLWELGTARAAPISLHDGGRILSVALSPDGQTLASASDPKGTRLWDLSQPGAEPVNPTALAGDGLVLSMAFSPNGQNLGLGYADGKVRLWDIEQPATAPTQLPGHEDRVYALAFSPDNQWLASGSWDGTIHVWEPGQPGSVLRKWNSHQGQVRSVAFSPDGQTLASGGDDASIRLWDLRQSEPTAIAELHVHERWVLSVAFSPDGHWLASAGADETVRLWDLRQLDADPIVLPGHESWAMEVTFSPDGQWLASAGADGKVRLWEVEQLDTAPIHLRGHDGTVTSIAFSPDGEVLVSGGEDRVIHIWIAHTDILADMVCEKVWRNLTQQEWDEFIGPDIPYERTCPDLPAGEGAKEASSGPLTLAGYLKKRP